MPPVLSASCGVPVTVTGSLKATWMGIDGADPVRAVGRRRRDVGHGRRGRVDDDVLVGAERAGRAGSGQGQGGGVVGGVLDRAAVERQRAVAA